MILLVEAFIIITLNSQSHCLFFNIDLIINPKHRPIILLSNENLISQIYCYHYDFQTILLPKFSMPHSLNANNTKESSFIRCF